MVQVCSRNQTQPPYLTAAGCITRKDLTTSSAAKTINSMASTTAVAAPASATTLLPVAGLPPPDMALPVLASVNNREQYRKRGEDETEEVSCFPIC
jgi:hypothetical protein